MSGKSKNKIEFGDFQTPLSLTAEISKLIHNSGFCPETIIEPNCGKGNFIFTSYDIFDNTKLFLGYDINDHYIKEASFLLSKKNKGNIEFYEKNFFETNWSEIIQKVPKPILVIGNPPWVTNSGLGLLKSDNLPVKSNITGIKGFDAISGKSNFDIAEWMLIKLLEAISGEENVLAMLCKTTIARKVYHYAMKKKIRMQEVLIYNIDAKKHFDVSADACLFICKLAKSYNAIDCSIYEDLSRKYPSYSIGIRDNLLISDIRTYEELRFLKGVNTYAWRSGIKHDLAKVMELRKEGDYFINGFGQKCKLEENYIYPLLKSSDLANNRIEEPKFWIIVPQKYIGEDTEIIKVKAPLTYQYLEKYRDLFLKRASVIYRNKPDFAIFGIGAYSFANWKIAISGLYKKLNFKKVGCYENKPHMLDDTCYFLPCENEEEADTLLSLLNSDISKKFLNSMIFWDSKRPITSSILQNLNISRLYKYLSKEKSILKFAQVNEKCQLLIHI